MTRDDLKEIISRITNTMEKQMPEAACLFGDDNPCEDSCDMTTFYGIGEVS